MTNENFENDADFQKFIFAGDDREWLTKAEAMKKMESINQANNYKKPYVKVGERESWKAEIEGTSWELYSYVNVYSKTWSRRVCKLIVDGQHIGTREARKYLA
jgi:hypothetical protein